MQRVQAPVQTSGPASQPPPSARRRLWFAAACIAGVLGIAIYAAIHFYGSGSSSTAQAHSGYVDAAACAECHRDIAASYAKTGMGRSIYLPGKESTVEDYHNKNQIFHAPSNSYYTMVERGGRFFQTRHQTGFDGKVANVAELQVDYVIGSGAEARSYLHRTAEGKLIELPVSWYSEKGGYWQMTPGYDHADQKDFHGAISYDCMFCHNGYPAQPPDKQIAASGEPIFPEKLPQGIDCQRCHGPGQAHIAAARAKEPEEHIRRTIVNPGTLPRDRQLEVCMECHLSTSGSQGSNVSLRYNRDIFSYVPGQPLSDYKLYFDYADVPGREDGFEIADAAYRLGFSQCFRNSKMTCITCHDPHEDAHGSKAETRYLETCQSCHKTVMHKAALPKNETCISCHMPKRRGEYATHVVLTDHYIQRQRPLRDLLAPVKEASAVPPKTALALYYPQKLAPSPENDLYLAVAQVESGVNLAQATSRLQELIEKTRPAEAGFYASLGSAYMRLANYPVAASWFQQALSRAPQTHAIVQQAAEAYTASGQLEQAKLLLEEATSHPPADSMLLANLGNVYARLGRLDDAEKVLRNALQLNPELGAANNLLGQVQQQKGNASEAERYFREAIRNRPDLAEAHTGLAEILIGANRMPEAEYEIHQALKIAPEDASAHHAFGMLLIVKGAPAAAESELRRAIALEPRNPQTHSDLADLLAEMRRLPEAEAEQKLAVELSRR